MEHKGMRHDLVCQHDRFPIVAVWKCYCRRENGGNGGNDAACCTNITQSPLNPKTRIITLLSCPPFLRVESNLIT